MSTKDVLKEAVTATPASITIGASLFGIPLQSWVLMLSMVLIASQLFWLFYNNIFRAKTNGNGQSKEGADGGGTSG